MPYIRTLSPRRMLWAKTESGGSWRHCLKLIHTFRWLDKYWTRLRRSYLPMDMSELREWLLDSNHLLTFGPEHTLKCSTGSCNIALDHEGKSIRAGQANPVIVCFLVCWLGEDFSYYTISQATMQFSTLISTSPGILQWILLICQIWWWKFIE
jgi:hypothetical protein